MGKLSASQIEKFINDGFVRLDGAFPVEVADACRNILWKASQCDPNNPATWTQPVVRIGEIALEPFKNAANTPLLHAAFDQLAGEGNWLPRGSLGSFPLRFPSAEEPNDTGWHVDASFPGEDANNYFEWRVNINSKSRALLMLFLFSEVSENDAPTRIRVGSHLEVARILKDFGDDGLSFMELAQRLDETAQRPEALATGSPGTVYLCHPFIAHAAQAHRGTTPKFMAQPPLLTKRDFNLSREDNDYCPVEIAILKGIR
ncbi:MAG: phytanoyl-CoA dioxygenase [Bacteroidota bacterium]